MSKIHDLQSQRFGRLVVICPTKKRKRRYIIWLCRCDCGNLSYVRSSHLLSESIKSCGCLWKDKSFKHGDAIKGNRLRLYNILASMKTRCSNPNARNYKYYGGKGITVCEEWANSYVAFRDWALANGYSDGLVIDRINHSGNYEPSNCQWITRSDNAKKAYKDRRK